MVLQVAVSASRVDVDVDHRIPVVLEGGASGALVEEEAVHMQMPEALGPPRVREVGQDVSHGLVVGFPAREGFAVALIGAAVGAGGQVDHAEGEKEMIGCPRSSGWSEAGME